MSNPDEPNFPAEYSVSSVADTRAPLLNLSAIRARMDSLQRFLSDSVNSNTLIGEDRMAMVSAEIESAIHQIFVNGSALLACSRHTNPPESNRPVAGEVTEPPDLRVSEKNEIKVDEEVKLKFEEDICELDCEIVELDAMELLAEHIHFCDVCGKGFKRDANLRMHMRAHGNQFKTPEALAKPDKGAAELGRKVRFSCPFDGCKRNKKHKKFRALKSVICVKNHFKRSHCPKMFSCNRCHKKSFSVVADLKSHLKHCGESKWLCSCGTSFSRKDKLFGHMALFEGHMPAVVDEDEKAKVVPAMEEDGDDKIKIVSTVEEDEDEDMGVNGLDNGIFEGLLDGFGSIENYCLQDMLGSPNCLVTGMEEFRDILQ